MTTVKDAVGFSSQAEFDDRSLPGNGDGRPKSPAVAGKLRTGLHSLMLGLTVSLRMVSCLPTSQVAVFKHGITGAGRTTGTSSALPLSLPPGLAAAGG